MVSMRYLCGVGEFSRTKSNPFGCLDSSRETGPAAMAKAMQKIRSGMMAKRGMADGNFGNPAG